MALTGLAPAVRPSRLERPGRIQSATRDLPAAVELVLLGAASMFTSLVTLVLKVSAHDYWLFNDFSIYWLAGRLVAAGQDPYDLTALAAAAQQVAISPVLELGYVYPILFAVLMVPLASLPLYEAAWLFTATSLLVFAVATAALIRMTPMLDGVGTGVRAFVALAIGTYPPVACSVIVGQVNLLVYGLTLAGATLLVHPRTARSAAGSIAAGVIVGVAGVVKLVPFVIVACLLFARRWRALAALVVVAVGALAASSLVVHSSAQAGSSLSTLFAPDAWWTNQSLNAFVTRLFVDTDRTRALLPPVVSVPLVSAALTGAFAAVTAILLWRARERMLNARGLGLAIGLVLVAASIGAPKISFWNHLPALVAAWLLLRSIPPPLGWRAFSRGQYALLAGWFFGAGIQWAVNFLPDDIQGSFAGARTLLNSSSLYGLMALWLLLARSLVAVPVQAHVEQPPWRHATAYLGVALTCGVLAAGASATAFPVAAAGSQMSLGVTYSPRYAEYLGLDSQATFERMLGELALDPIRLPVYWDLIEPKPGAFDFSTVDFYVSQAGARGKSVVPVLGVKVPRWPECFMPTWATQLGPEAKERAILDLLNAEVAHLQTFQNVAQWQVENEPYFGFGDCTHTDSIGESFLGKEIALVHQMDSRPVLITDSGEFSTWISAQRASDLFGTSIYRGVWLPRIGVLPYPIPAWAYTAKDRLIRAVTGTHGQTIVSELQAEAWFQGGQSVLDVPPDVQIEEFPPAIISNNVEYARETGFGVGYLWGVEWWYWMEAQGYPGYLATAKTLSSTAAP